ncbi:MFS transporter [Microbacterium lacticum]|uniref:MFS transporter n=1 Tax=Microbacterium lacticum TaxID=33885 RepID=UPI0018B06190|nr:MFS transporter [Microbacterium lacticum]MBF9336196.1 MFS transporter [Microbacterium lacticum]
MKRVAVIYLASYTISLFGNSIAAVALPLIVLATTGNVFGAGLLALASGIPSVLGGLFGGVLIDRVNRRTASIASDLISAGAVAALPIVDLVLGLNLGWFIVFAVIGAFGDIPGMTARETMLPAIVRHSGISAERLMGIRESIAPLVMLLGPGIAGTLMFTLDGTTVLWVTAATSGIAALTTLLLPRAVGVIVDDDGQPVNAPTSLRTAGSELREGLRFLFRGNPLVRGVLVINLLLIGVLTGFQNVVLPAHFTSIGQGGTAGFVLSAVGLGTLLGAGLYAVLGPRIRRRTWFTIGMGGTVAGFTAIALLPATPLILAGAVLVGLSTGPVGALLGVLLIESIPERLRGRVTGAQNAVLTTAPPVAAFGAAVLATWLGLRAAALVLLCAWIACVVFSLFGKAFRNLEPNDHAATEADHADQQ